MDDAWERDVNGAAPSFPELLATGARTRRDFVSDYLCSRGLAASEVDIRRLEEFLNRIGGTISGNRDGAERALDALLRVRPEHVMRQRTGRTRGHAA